MPNAPLPFLKMHGLGNDFVIFDLRMPEALNFTPSPDFLRSIADRRVGIGCDQILCIGPSASQAADAKMTVYNSDGSDGGMCGNGLRCVGLILLDEGKKTEVILETCKGLSAVRRAEDPRLVTVNMGEPALEWQEIPLARPETTTALSYDFNLGNQLISPPQAVNMGNPHLVLFVEDADKIDLAEIGPSLEHHTLFPERTNVEIVSLIEKHKLRVRIWERGSGMTLACGTGSCAAAVAAMRAKFISERDAEIVMDGGTAYIRWDQNSNHVFLTGPATFVFKGVVPSDVFRQKSVGEVF